MFYYFKYFYVDGEGFIEIVIIRLEMMLGDIVIVVNFNDEWYKDVIGKIVILLIVGCELFILVDEYVDIDFGFGVMKVILVYDFNDFEIG